MSKKQAIAEKLLSDQTLSGEEIVWLLSHLPDIDIKGENSTSIYKHEETDILEAVGLNKKEWSKKLQEVLNDIAEFLRGKYLVSQIVEKWVSQNDYDIFKFLSIIAVDKFTEDFIKFNDDLTAEQLHSKIAELRKKFNEQ